ncbi:hypothetical protein [Arthrobacter castelli]|uniref:hypothetical protein n=1 Tax=Arthrobacter castelli TaxID=271431 RepID=UPI00041ECA7F|nr:hypothetical protein [Arthrobacter castelli]
MSTETTTDDDEHTDEDSGDDSTPARPKRPKVTGGQLEAGFDQWVAARRTRFNERTPQETRRTGCLVVVVVLGLALVSLAVLSGVATSSFETARAQNAARIDELKTQITETAHSASEAMDAASLAALNTAAASAAAKVAAEQQKFAVLYTAMNDELSTASGDGTPSAALEAIVEHRKDLEKYWNPDSFVAGDNADEFVTGGYYEADKIDPRFPWYIRYDNQVAADPDSYTWRVESVMPHLDTPAAASVVWTCRDQQGRVLAWASAVYSGESAVFSDLELVVTAAGGRHTRTDDSSPAVDVPELKGGGQ